MRLMKTALFIFGLASVFFIIGNSFAQNGMHQHGQAMMGMQTGDSTVTMPGNTMIQPGTRNQYGQMGMQNDSTVMMQGQSMTEPNQAICPVMGNKIDKNVFADYKGKRIYFCCGTCLEAFKKNPEKYLQLMEKQGIRLQNIPAAKSGSEKSGT